eukprot:TRINITY_DN10328_c0_g1_i1.p2 TRINITY_DN10328_c0_g1~~TRINITY_DN10328_c0_g1_i1.p2  ORF type:complete len:120 (+),score=15.58 TRINITY_DN10328_c0_g1_i1:64-423(+)
MCIRDRSNTLKSEIDNVNAIDNKFVNNTMYRLAELIKNKLSQKDSKEVDNDARKNALLAINQILDTIVLDEFFEIFIDPNKRFMNQHYFQYVEQMNMDQMNEMISIKFDYIKGKLSMPN